MANESTSSTLSELYTEIVAEALFVASRAINYETSSTKLCSNRWWKV